MAIKRVLITGSNSYVGTNVEKWLMKEPDKFYVETISVRGDAWKSFDFSKFDVVFHVAGIAHIKEINKNKDLYFRVNRDLALDVAKKAKESSVLHFIFISSMSVYNFKNGAIFSSTNTNPISNYGKSKLEAEFLISKLVSKEFSLTILRPPMIYGYKSPGNYNKLSRFIKKFRFFPDYNNTKSFIHIDNLSEFIKLIIIQTKKGIYHPQNNYKLSTTDFAVEISKIFKIKVNFIKISLIINILKFIPLLKKVFSTSYYDNSLYSKYEIKLINKSSVRNFSDSIKYSEFEHE